jgi:hypothetical protein
MHENVDGAVLTQGNSQLQSLLMANVNPFQ